MCLRRAHVIACCLVLLVGLSPMRARSADEIGATVGTKERPLARLGLIATPPAATMPVLALLDAPRAPFNLVSLPFTDTPLGLPAPRPKPRNDTPFGLRTLRAPPGAMWTKWEKVSADIKAEAPALARCRANSHRCSKAAARFVAIVKQAAREQGRKRLELVNERVNAAIAYTSDMAQWKVSDRWSAPLDRHKTGAFDTGKGDCEDYAIAKYVALREAGTSADDLQVLMVRDTSVGAYHAVLAARLDGRWLLLDNRWSRLIENRDATFFTPLFALDAGGVKKFMRGANRIARLKTPVPAAVSLLRQAGPQPARLVMATPGSLVAILTSSPRNSRPAGRS